MLSMTVQIYIICWFGINFVGIQWKSAPNISNIILYKGKTKQKKKRAEEPSKEHTRT